MRSFLKKISAICLVFFGLIYLISYASISVLRYSSFYKSSFLVNQVPQESFDYIVLGASDGLTTLNTKVIDSILSVDGINLSMDDTSFSSHYLMLQHFLAEGKQTKYCILVARYSSFDSKLESINDNDYRFAMYNNRSYVSEYYKQFSGTKANILYYSKWMPFLSLSYFNTELFYPSLICAANFEKRNRFDDKGNYTYPVIKRGSSNSKNESIKVEFTNEYLTKIKTLCEANDIELICYISPHISKKAITNSKDYRVINHSNVLQNPEYFYDDIHVNSIGREISSNNFALDFKEYLDN